MAKYDAAARKAEIAASQAANNIVAPANETPEQARARTIANVPNPVQNAPTTPVVTIQPVAPTPEPVAPTPAQVTQPVQQPTQPSYTSQEGITTVAPVWETPEQERARTEATAAQNIAAREAPKPALTTTVEKPIKQEAPVIDYNTSVGRESEIQKNLQEGAKNAPALFKDRATFNAAYGYDTADAGKKALLDSFFNSQQVVPDENTLFAQIVSGQTQWIDTKSTAYTSAKKRADNYQRFSNYNPNQFSSALRNGDILEGSQTWKDLQSNPQAKANIQKAKTLNQINGEQQDVNNSAKTIMKDIVETTGIGSAFSDGIITADEMNAMTNSPAIERKTQEIEELKNEYDKQKNLLKAIETQVDEELKWTGATSSRRAALIAERAKPIKENLDNAADTYNNAVATLGTLKTEAAKLLDTNLGLYREQSAFERQKALADYQAQLGLKTDQAKFEQGLLQNAQAASDPTTAIKMIMDEYSKQGIPFTESLATKLESFKNSGMTIGDYTKQMIKDVQAKPEYERIKEMTLGQLSDREKLAAQVSTKTPDWKQDESGNWYNANASISPSLQTTGATGDLRSYASQFPNEASLKNNNPAGITFNSTFAKTLENAWIQFEKGTARPAAEGGNYFSFPTIEEGFKAYDLLWSSPSYQNRTVGEALNRWGTGSLPGVDTTKKVSDLTDEERRTLQMAQIKKESPGMYKVLSSQQNKSEDMSEAAKRAVASKNITGTAKDQEVVLNELSKKWVFDKWEWNQNFYTAKPDVKAEMPSLITGYDMFEKAKAIIQKHKNAGDLDEMLGSYDAAQERLKSKTWAFIDKSFQDDFNTLDQIFGKELSQYMNKISGATVGDKEVERLKRQVPNMDMSESEFENAMNAYEESLKNANRFFINNYGFNDINTARKILLWADDKNISTQTTEWEWGAFFGAGATAPTTVSNLFSNY